MPAPTASPYFATHLRSRSLLPAPPSGLRTACKLARTLFFDAHRRSTSRSVYANLKDVDLSPLAKAWDSLWKLIHPLLAEHAFLTIICAFFALMMTLSFYRFLKSISPGLVAFILLLIFGILTLHWTFTRTEPPFLKPAIDLIAPFFPMAPAYKDPSKSPSATPAKPAPAKPAAPKPAKS
jgi:hypothetical protein